MKMQYLKKRAGVYYFRRVLPSDVQKHFPRREIWKSVRTKIQHQAIIIVRQHSSALDSVIFHIRSGILTAEEIKRIVAKYIKRNLDDHETFRALNPGKSKDHSNNVSSFHETILRHMKILADRDHTCSEIYSEAYRLISERNLNIELDSNDFNRLCFELVKGRINLFKTLRDRFNGDYKDDHLTHIDQLIRQDAAASPFEPHQQKPQPTKVLLSAAINKYFTEREEDDEIDKMTLAEYRAGCKNLIDLVGDKPAAELTREDIRHFQKQLSKVPAYAATKKETKGKSLIEAIAAGEKHQLTTLSESSLEKKLGTVKGFIEWASSDGVRIMPYNVGKDIKVSKPKIKSKAVDKRKALDNADLQGMVTGFLTERDLGTFLKYPERYWIQLIAIFSGMRLEEIAQLLTSDVKEIEDIWCFDANWFDENEQVVKHLKNNNAKRLIPLHPELIKLGLLDYVEQVKAAKQPRLWMVLSRAAKSGKYQRKFKDWYNGTDRRTGFRKTYISVDPLKTFHSTRHTITNFFKQNAFQEHVVAELLGQEHPNITYSTYGNPLRAQTKLTTLEKLHYDVDFFGQLGHWFDFSKTDATWTPPKDQGRAVAKDSKTVGTNI